MDLTPTVEPKSDQLNYDDVAHGTLTITITQVKAGPPDQPVELHNPEFPGRPYKPGKSMRRVLIAAWGKEGSAYVGRQLTLYGDPTIKFGKDEIGGIRIRAMSHLSEPLTVALTVTRGKRTPFTVQPLASSADTIDKAIQAVNAANDASALDAIEKHARTLGINTDERLTAAISARRAEVPS